MPLQAYNRMWLRKWHWAIGLVIQLNLLPPIRFCYLSRSLLSLLHVILIDAARQLLYAYTIIMLCHYKRMP